MVNCLGLHAGVKGRQEGDQGRLGRAPCRQLRQQVALEIRAEAELQGSDCERRKGARCAEFRAQLAELS